MDNGNGIQPVMPVGGGSGLGDSLGSFGGIIGLLAVLGMIGNGGLFGNNANIGNDALAAAIAMGANRGYEPQYATQDFVQASNNFMSLVDQNRDLSAQISNGTAQSVAATNQVYHDIVGNLGDKYAELARDIAAVSSGVQQAIAHQNECCGSTKMMIADAGAKLSAQIAESKYDNALALAGLEQRLTAKMDANTIQTLRDQVDALRDQVNLSGVLRFPNAWTYGAGPFPPIFGGCCNNV